MKIRPASEKDIPSLADLLNSGYARKHDPAYFVWQFFESHYPTVCITAWDGHKLAGMFGMQKRLLTDGTPVGHLIDLFIDPGYRGQGLFARSCDTAIEYFGDLKAITVLPNLNGKNSCVKSLKMECIAKIDDLIISGKTHVKNIARMENKELIGFGTDKPFRIWRYDKNPVYQYRNIGGAVTKEFTDPVTGDQFTDIVDWTQDPQPQNIDKIIDTINTGSAKTISTWALEHTPLHGILTGMGFRPMPRQRYFCVRPLDDKYSRLTDITNWRLVPADAEIY